jgi:hypothetical protein
VYPSPPGDPLYHLTQGRMGPIGPLTSVLGPQGAVYFALGTASAVVGIFLLVWASLIDVIVGATGTGCATNPLCADAPALHVIFLVIGGGLIALGVTVGVYAFRGGVRGGPWMTLPP